MNENSINQNLVNENIISRIPGEIAACRRRIDLIVVHCSATSAGRDLSAADLRKWHITERNFSDIGYHFIVRLDGTIERGRPLERIGAHCRGQNARSIGICYVGGLDAAGHPADTRTAAQKVALSALLRAIRTVIPEAAIRGHSDFANKACPCFRASTEYAEL